MTRRPGIVITYPFPLAAFNGGARMTREIALNLGRRGIPVYLMPVSVRLRSHFPRRVGREERLGYELDAEYAAAGVEITRIAPHPVHPYLDGLMIRRALQKLLAEKPVAAVLSYYHEGLRLPDFLHPRGIPFAVIAVWQSYEAALRLPSKVRKPLHFLSDYIKRQMIINMHRKADYFFPISDHTKQELERLMGLDPARTKTCYLGVAPEFGRIERPKPDKISRILFFGRVVESKGVADAIQALRQLKARGCDDWEFYISGEGRLNWARSLIAGAGLERQVCLVQPEGDGQLRRLLSSSHLVLLPSHSESFGLSFAEAQAAGLPVIGYAAGSVPEVVAHGETGWLAPTGDVGQLASWLEKAVANPERTYQMGVAGRARVARLFTWDRTADTILYGLEQIGAGKLL